jgi:peptidoglycan/LPS O-acetylase OafA/YrhL
MRNQTLDVLRGFLSWVVVWVHAVWFAGHHGGIAQAAGVYAVDGFIVLSGFVITQLLVTKKEPYPVFIFRRFMRLFPVFAACIAIALLLNPFVYGKVQSELIREASETQYFWWHVLTHTFLMHGVVPSIWLPQAQWAFVPPGWSISLEFQLYLVAPLALWWVSRSSFNAIALTGASAAVFLPPVIGALNDIWSPIGAFLPQHFLFFLIGMLAYFLFAGRGKQIRYWQGFVLLGEISYSNFLGP